MARQERVCKECDSGEVEDVDHWLMRCEVKDCTLQRNAAYRAVALLSWGCSHNRCTVMA